MNSVLPVRKPRPLTLFSATLCAGVFLVLLSACSSDAVVKLKDNTRLSDIAINLNGAAIESRPDMVEVCKGFILSRSQIIEYYAHSTLVDDKTAYLKHNILPCYAAGSAVINDSRYKWKIYAGGIGEFTSDSKRFLKVCGKDCCQKMPDVCQ
ncbi:MAG: hypothetical protein GC149_18765 [Gammaproteobacteria bacterium]|nr:hypothetical protein [Gammaproteobacteria bacterium]